MYLNYTHLTLNWFDLFTLQEKKKNYHYKVDIKVSFRGCGQVKYLIENKYDKSYQIVL